MPRTRPDLDHAPATCEWHEQGWIATMPDDRYYVHLWIHAEPATERWALSVEVTHAETKELIAWWLLPLAQGFKDLTEQIEGAKHQILELLDRLGQPF